MQMMRTKFGDLEKIIGKLEMRALRDANLIHFGDKTSYTLAKAALFLIRFTC